MKQKLTGSYIKKFKKRIKENHDVVVTPKFYFLIVPVLRLLLDFLLSIHRSDLQILSTIGILSAITFFSQNPLGFVIGMFGGLFGHILAWGLITMLEEDRIILGERVRK
jgi:hypothetical protein